MRTRTLRAARRSPFGFAGVPVVVPGVICSPGSHVVRFSESACSVSEVRIELTLLGSRPRVLPLNTTHWSETGESNPNPSVPNRLCYLKHLSLVHGPGVAP